MPPNRSKGPSNGQSYYYSARYSTRTEIQKEGGGYKEISKKEQVQTKSSYQQEVLPIRQRQAGKGKAHNETILYTYSKSQANMFSGVRVKR